MLRNGSKSKPFQWALQTVVKVIKIVFSEMRAKSEKKETHPQSNNREATLLFFVNCEQNDKNVALDTCDHN